MLINVACLESNKDDIAHANLLALLEKQEVSSLDDIAAILGQIYEDPNCPYPMLGTVKANSSGIIHPKLSNKLFFITIVQGGPIILEDFGAGKNRLDNLKRFCALCAQKKYSIWEFASEWKRTHHKTSIEALVYKYVDYVCSAYPESSYKQWLGAEEYIEQIPFLNNKTSLHIVVDLSSFDTSTYLQPTLEDFFFKQVVKKHNRELEAKAQMVVRNFMEFRGLTEDLIIGESPENNYVSHDKLDSIKKSLMAHYSKMTAII